jgi:hypothetical protein
MPNQARDGESSPHNPEEQQTGNTRIVFQLRNEDVSDRQVRVGSMTEFKQWWVIAPAFWRVTLLGLAIAGITAIIGMFSFQAWVVVGGMIAASVISVIMWVGYYIGKE